MATQNGIMRYNGTLAGVRHYRVKGSPAHYAAMVGGPTKDQIKSLPQFQRTRENMTEFGGSAIAAKAIRSILTALPKMLTDNSTAGRLTAIVKRIISQDQEGIRGARKIKISAHRHFLVGFRFKKKVTIDQSFKVRFKTTHTINRNAASITVPPFDPLIFLHAPSGATHFQIINAIVVVSDYAYNEKTATSEPEDVTINKMYSIAYSSNIPTNQHFTGETITSILPNTTLLPPNSTVIQCIGIQFNQLVNGHHHALQSKKCLMILDAF